MLPPFTLALYPEVPVIRTADARIDSAGPSRAERQAAVIDVAESQTSRSVDDLHSSGTVVTLRVWPARSSDCAQPTGAVVAEVDGLPVGTENLRRLPVEVVEVTRARVAPRQAQRAGYSPRADCVHQIELKAMRRPVRSKLPLASYS